MGNQDPQQNGAGHSDGNDHDRDGGSGDLEMGMIMAMLIAMAIVNFPPLCSLLPLPVLLVSACTYVPVVFLYVPIYGGRINMSLSSKLSKVSKFQRYPKLTQGGPPPGCFMKVQKHVPKLAIS